MHTEDTITPNHKRKGARVKQAKNAGLAPDQLALELAGLAFRQRQVASTAKQSSAPAVAPFKTALPIVFSKLSPAVPTVVYPTYWRFAAERQNVYFKRLDGSSEPWTADPILQTYKFTNAYRASDRVSQYLIRNVIYRPDLPSEAREVFFRIMLFKLFNKIETWELLERSLGKITFVDFSFRMCDQLLSDALRRGRRIYSAAYIMPPGGTAFGHQFKHQNHLDLLASMLRNDVPSRLQDARRMQEGFEILKSFPTIGDFLAYQFITDINYSEITDFSEREFVVAGPGARDGLRKCFSDLGGLSEAEMIRFMADSQEAEFERLGLTFKNLWGRPLQLIDCQNVFCETDKYARMAHPEVKGISGRLHIKQQFVPKRTSVAPMYPPKWKLDVPKFPAISDQQALLL
jgi:alpha-glutamyl/putrescinyl thymine pyrophosphorylase clade 1